MKSMDLLATLLKQSYALSLTLAICKASKVRPAPPPNKEEEEEEEDDDDDSGGDDDE